MADQDLRIRVAAETGAAQDALGKLADEMAGLAKASDGAGKEQQTLAKQTALTTQQVSAAREAVERAKRAQAEAAAVTQHFGKESREAAQAHDRLRSAELAATKATRTAEVALTDTAKAISEAAQSADKKALPALNRMSTALQRAGKDASKSAQDLRLLEVRMSATNKETHSLGGAASSGGSSLGSLGSLAGVASKALGPAALAGAAVMAARAIGEASAEVFTFNTAVANIPFGLDKARKATGGLVGDLQLAKSAAQGVSLGVIKTEEEFSALAEAAVKLGIKLGIGPTQALDNMMTALGRGSTEVLDNLGIVLKAGEANDRFAKSIGKVASELTEAEKKLAFKTEAIKLLKEAAANTAVEFDGGAAAVGRFGTRVDNAKLAVKSFAVDVTGDMIAVGEMTAEHLSEEHINKRTAALVAHADEMRRLERGERARQEAEMAYRASIGDDGFHKRTQEEAAAMEAAGDAAFKANYNLGLVDAALDRAVAAASPYLDSLNVQIEKQRELAGAAARRAKAEDDLWDKLAKRNASAEDKALEEAFFKANEMGPALPPGYEAPKEAKGKRKPKVSTDPTNRVFDGRDESTELRLAGGREQAERQAERQAAADLAAFEAESALREKRVAGIDNEIAAIEARGIAEAERVDAVFFTIEVETEAARVRESLIEQRLGAEQRLAAWQVKNAKSDADREKAQTRLDAAEQAKRLNTLRKSADAETKEHARRQATVEKVSGAMTLLGNGMISAFERMAEGEKGAIASMLAELLKGVAKKHAILALGEIAQGVGSQAMTFGVPNPKSIAHFTAAGLHTGVAIAAGVGAAAAGAVASAQRGGGGGSGAESSGFGKRPSSSGAGGNGGSGDAQDEGLEAQDVPVSHEQLRRGNPNSDRNASRPGSQVIISGPVHLYGAGGRDEFVSSLRKDMDRQDRAGRRART